MFHKENGAIRITPYIFLPQPQKFQEQKKIFKCNNCSGLVFEMLLDNPIKFIGIFVEFFPQPKCNSIFRNLSMYLHTEWTSNNMLIEYISCLVKHVPLHLCISIYLTYFDNSMTNFLLIFPIFSHRKKNFPWHIRPLETFKVYFWNYGLRCISR